MITTYLKTAWRAFLRNKLFTIINAIGLTIGICAAVVIGAIVHFDFSFDNYHPAKDRIYRVVSDFTFSGEPYHNGGVTAPLAAAAEKEVAGLAAIAPFHLYGYQTKVTIPGAGEPKVFKKRVTWHSPAKRISTFSNTTGSRASRRCLRKKTGWYLPKTRRSCTSRVFRMPT